MKHPVFALLLSLLLFTSNANAIDLSAETIIEHPGSLELAYLGYQDRTPPLSPLGVVRANNRYFYVLPEVTKPSIQSIYLLEHTVIKPGESVLDIGSGSGIQAIFAALNASRVVATDLSHAAVENTRFNAEGHQLTHKIESYQGDLFRALKKKERFDVIIFNINYPYNEKTQFLWQVHERFFQQVSDYLNPGGRIYYQSGLISNIPKTHQMVKENKLRIMRMDMASSLQFNREPIVYVIIKDPLVTDLPK